MKVIGVSFEEKEHSLTTAYVVMNGQIIEESGTIETYAPGHQSLVGAKERIMHMLGYTWIGYKVVKETTDERQRGFKGNGRIEQSEIRRFLK